MERFAFVGAVLAYAWLFIITLFLDAITTRFVSFGFSDRFIGSTLLAIAAVLPEAKKAVEKDKRIFIEKSVLEGIAFKILFALAVPWLAKSLYDKSPVRVSGSILTTTLGCFLAVFALIAALLARTLPKRKAVRFCVIVYVTSVCLYGITDAVIS